MKLKPESSSSPLLGVSSLNQVTTIPTHPTSSMGRLGDTTVNSPPNYGMNAEEEVCKSEVDGKEYHCPVGHCCPDAKCCTYYYELWWFWLIWTLIIMMSCCCAYHHRKKRTQRNRGSGNGAGEPYAGTCNYPGPPIDKGMLGYCKLPKYEDIARIPPSGSPPPPYRSRRALNSIAQLESDAEGVTIMNFLSYHDLTSSALSLVSSFGFTFRQRDERSDRRCTQIAREPSLCQSNEDDSYEGPDPTMEDDRRSDAPSYFVENEVSCSDGSQEKRGIHIIDCCQSGDLAKKTADVDSTRLDPEQNSPSEPDLNSMDDEDCMEEILIRNSENTLNMVDEKPINQEEKKRHRQDSGIGAEEGGIDFRGSMESLAPGEDNQNSMGSPASDRQYTKMLSCKQNGLSKQFEKSKISYPVKLGMILSQDDMDSSSSDDDEDDDRLHHLLDLNNNGTSTSASNTESSQYIAHDLYSSEGCTHDLVLELSPIYPETYAGESSHSAINYP